MTLERKTVLVTGGAGYIGSEIVRALLKSGCQVIVADDLSQGHVDAIPKGVVFYRADIRDYESIKAVFSKHCIFAVIHLAARIEVEESISNPLEYYSHNVGGLLNLLTICREFNITKFIFSSSGTVYGNANHSSGVQRLHENSLVAPLSAYGHSKLIGEQILKDIQLAYGLNYIALRYFNVAGASSDGLNGQRRKNASHIIHVACDAAIKGKNELTIFGNDYATEDGTCIRDYIHVSDVADIHIEALKFLLHNPSSHILNCGYGEGFSVKTVIDTFKKVNEVELKIKYGKRRAGDPVSLVGDCSSLQNLLRWKAKHNSLELICRSAFQWHSSLACKY